MRIISTALIISAIALATGCENFAVASDQRITEADVFHAKEQGLAIVEADVRGAKRNAVGTRSEGFLYPFTVRQVLLASSQDWPLISTYDYSKTPRLSAGPYLLILRPGPYFRIERLTERSRRADEVAQWIEKTKIAEPADPSNHSPRVTPAADAPVAPRSDGR